MPLCQSFLQSILRKPILIKTQAFIMVSEIQTIMPTQYFHPWMNTEVFFSASLDWQMQQWMNQFSSQKMQQITNSKAYCRTREYKTASKVSNYNELNMLLGPTCKRHIKISQEIITWFMIKSNNKTEISGKETRFKERVSDK